MEYATGTSRSTADGTRHLKHFSKRQENCWGEGESGFEVTEACVGILILAMLLHLSESVFSLKNIKIMTMTSSSPG